MKSNLQTGLRFRFKKEGQSSILREVKSDAILPTVRHRCNNSWKEAVLPRQNEAKMVPAKSLHASAQGGFYRSRVFARVNTIDYRLKPPNTVWVNEIEIFGETCFQKTAVHSKTYPYWLASRKISIVDNEFNLKSLSFSEAYVRRLIGNLKIL